jgi:hypothetical protein
MPRTAAAPRTPSPSFSSRVARWALALGVLGSAGCPRTPRGLYLDALGDQTEMAVIYNGFGTALRLRATYLSPAFRAELAEERRRLTGCTDEAHARFVQMMAEDAATYHEVIFTAESDIEAKTEFTGVGDDKWQIRLEADGAEQPLVTVYRVRDVSALHEMLYAHKNLWNELWIARFERKTAEPTTLRFTVGSGWGHDELLWTSDQLR